MCKILISLIIALCCVTGVVRAQVSPAAESMPCADADRANTLLESGRARALGANVPLGIGAALGIAAGALWLLGAPVAEARHVRVWLGVSAGRAGIVLVGRL